MGCHPVLEGLGKAVLQQGEEAGRLVSLGLQEGGAGGEHQGGGLKGAIWDGVEEAYGGKCQLLYLGGELCQDLGSADQSQVLRVLGGGLEGARFAEALVASGRASWVTTWGRYCGGVSWCHWGCWSWSGLEERR